jgi:endonuclease/exonuclease/phosphatase family metal-dependent hydrolase
MSMRVLPVMLLSLLARGAADAVPLRVASFNIGAHFADTYFDYSLGDPGTADHESVKTVLARINADVVALQEIHSVDLKGSPNDVEALASALGYPHVFVPPLTGAFDTSLRVVFLSRWPFLSTGQVQSPTGARELTRLHPVVRVDVPGTGNDPWLTAVHLKAGTLLSDRFQRAVELKRLVIHLGSLGLAADANWIVLGDFNPSAINATFSAVPDGVPSTFVPGADLSFPIQYSTQPLDAFPAPKPVRLDPRQVNGSPSTYGTTFNNGPALDLILVSPSIGARAGAAEVYNSVLDGNAAAAGLPKAGAAPDPATSANASDHHAVFADLEMDDPADRLTADVPWIERFAAANGEREPAGWSTRGSAVWTGVDDGGSTLPGWRCYGPAGGTLGHLGAGQAATAVKRLRNGENQPLTALTIALDAAQWRAARGGAVDRIEVAVVAGGRRLMLPALSFAASASLASGAISSPAWQTLRTTVGGLAIAPGDPFDIELDFVPGQATAALSDEVFINEFHYDNSGTDTGEFVEVAVAPGCVVPLSQISLWAYNGADGKPYGVAHTLDTFVPGVVTAGGHRLFHKAIADLQNGPDGLALAAAGRAVQFISYEGVFSGVGGPADGMVSVSCGVSQSTTEAAGSGAIGLTGRGAGAGDFTWMKFAGQPHTPGSPNAGQSMALPEPGRQGLAIDNLTVGFLADHDLDGLADGADADDDNDALSDAAERVFGTDPLDAGSRFVQRIEAGAGGELALVFPAASGRTFLVEASTDLSRWLTLSSHAGNGTSLRIPLARAGAARFYRIRAVLMP